MLENGKSAAFQMAMFHSGASSENDVFYDKMEMKIVPFFTR